MLRYVTDWLAGRLVGIVCGGRDVWRGRAGVEEREKGGVGMFSLQSTNGLTHVSSWVCGGGKALRDTFSF